jgi:hemolysin activation/secretion protein
VSGEGQVATQPLVSIEQFGIGGLGSVRGYQEGELYGDNGWYVQTELRAPVLRPKEMFEGKPVDLGLTLSAFTDFGEIFLIDPQTRESRSDLWGAGFAGAWWFGPQFSGRVAVAWPLLNSPSRSAGTVRVSFGITAQF